MVNLGLEKIDEAKRKADIIFRTGDVKGFPLFLTHMAVRHMIKEMGLPPVDDVFAFVTNGKGSDSMIIDWMHPRGGF